MKSLKISALLYAAAVQAHYHFERLVINGVEESQPWVTVRKVHDYNNSLRGLPVAWNDGTDIDTILTSQELRCNQDVFSGADAVAEVQAGDNLGFRARPAIFHDGPIQFYMAKVPEGKDISSYDPVGEEWFKVAYGGHIEGKGGIVWPANGATYVNFTIPTNLPSGDYIVHIEHIGMNAGGGFPNPQFYVSCAEVRVSGGGSGSPGPLVAFPGVYTASDEGLYQTVYPPMTTYSPPGPAVWDGN